MILEEFEILPETRQLDLLYEQGVYIGKCTKGEKIAILLQLDSFYVELFYRNYRTNIQRIHVFSSPSKIDEYLSPIDIENLAH